MQSILLRVLLRSGILVLVVESVALGAAAIVENGAIIRTAVIFTILLLGIGVLCAIFTNALFWKILATLSGVSLLTTSIAETLFLQGKIGFISVALALFAPAALCIVCAVVGYRFVRFEA